MAGRHLPAMQAPSNLSEFVGNTRCPITFDVFLFLDHSPQSLSSGDVLPLLNTGHALLCRCRYEDWFVKEPVLVSVDPLHHR